MTEKELPPPPGCWRVLLGFPVAILVLRIADPWQNFLLPLLPPHLSADAVATIFGFSLLAIMFVVWMAILKIVDLAFGTKLYPYGPRATSLPTSERPQLRRRGLLIILGIVAADQATKFAFGVAHPVVTQNPPALAPDAILIVDSLGLLLLLVILWRSRERLQSLAISLMLGGAASAILDQVLRKSVVVLQFYAFGLTPVFSLAEIAAVVGLALFAVSWFWEPRLKTAAPSLPERNSERPTELPE
jgi:hypothetical protein